MIRVSTFLAACLIAIGICARFADAQAATSQEYPRGATARPRPGGGAGPGLGLPRLSAAQQTAFIDFMKQNSPNRLRYINSLTASTSRQQLVIQFIDRWQSIARLKTADQEIYPIRLQTLQLEDEVFGLMLQIKAASPAGASPTLQAKIHDDITKLVDLNFAERDVRLNRMQKLLADEKNKLANDRNQRDQIIQNQMAGLDKREANLQVSPELLDKPLNDVDSVTVKLLGPEPAAPQAAEPTDSIPAPAPAPAPTRSR
jgi:hypothetical protein